MSFRGDVVWLPADQTFLFDRRGGDSPVVSDALEMLPSPDTACMHAHKTHAIMGIHTEAHRKKEDGGEHEKDNQNRDHPSLEDENKKKLLLVHRDFQTGRILHSTVSASTGTALK